MRRTLFSHAVTVCFLTLVGATVYHFDEPRAGELARDDEGRIHAETCQACLACRLSRRRALPDVIDETWQVDYPAGSPFAANGLEEPAEIP